MIRLEALCRPDGGKVRMRLEESVASFQLNSSLIPGNIFNCHLELVLDSSDSGSNFPLSHYSHTLLSVCCHDININLTPSLVLISCSVVEQNQKLFALNYTVCVLTIPYSELNKCWNWKCRTTIIKFDVGLIFSTFTLKLGTKNDSSNFLISCGRNKKQKLILWSLLFLFSEKPL